MSKEENEKNRIKYEFDEIQSENGDFDFSKHLARPEDLPDLGEIEIYDYDSDLTVASQQAMDVLEPLVDLYLGDVPKLKEHPYINILYDLQLRILGKSFLSPYSSALGFSIF
jgi:hypothetical protein